MLLCSTGLQSSDNCILLVQSTLVIVDLPVSSNSTVKGQKHAKINNLCPLKGGIPLFQDTLLQESTVYSVKGYYGLLG